MHSTQRLDLAVPRPGRLTAMLPALALLGTYVSGFVDWRRPEAPG